ncbi:MAG: hypothetical protein A2W34_02605 [Chloroflexi bacterium RBG_16_64_32]|nr:MAG: hypothetical protein A2W34_02605 [Chloroflexi bacterium RBG_16_64_32]
MMRIGLLGFGKMGRMRLKAARFLRGATVTAVADSSKRALEAARRQGVPHVYADYHDLLASPAVDAVIITVPNAMHEEAITAAALAGKHIFVEKPLARSSDECLRITDAVDRAEVAAMVGHNYRYFPPVKRLKRDLDSGALGDIVLSTLEIVDGPLAPALESRPIPDWYMDPGDRGPWLLDLGYHVIDLFLWFFGDARVLHAYLDRRYGFAHEDNASILLESGAGAKGTVHVGWFSKLIFPSFDFRVILHGTAGFASTDQYTPASLKLHAAIEGAKNTLRRTTGRRIHPLSYTFYYGSYIEELQQFVNSVRSGTQPPTTIKDGCETVRTIEEIYGSAARSPALTNVVSTAAGESLRKAEGIR